MKSRKLQKFIENFIKEYTGTGASGGNATDGNDITSPRPFPDDTAEILNYTLKNIYGGDGGHYKGEPVTQNPNRVKMAMFEDLKNLIRKELNEQAYGHATLTSQGQSISGAPGVWETDPLGDEDRKQEDLIRMMEQPGAPGEPQGGEEGKDKKPKVKEKPPKYSPEKIGECKAKCVDLELENFEITVTETRKITRRVKVKVANYVSQKMRDNYELIGYVNLPYDDKYAPDEYLEMESAFRNFENQGYEVNVIETISVDEHTDKVDITEGE